MERRRIRGRDGGPGPCSGRGPGDNDRQGCPGNAGRAVGQGGASKAGGQGGADGKDKANKAGRRRSLGGTGTASGPAAGSTV